MDLSGGVRPDSTGHGETCWQFPEMIGKGVFRQIEFRPGFHLFITDYHVKQQCEWHIACNRPGFGFGFCISGEMHGRSRWMGRPVRTCGGQCPLFYYPCQTGAVADAEDTYKVSFSIIVEPEVFNTLVGGDWERFPGAFRSIADGSREGSYWQPGAMTPEILAALESVRRCPLSGSARRLFLESRTLELLAYRLQQIEEPRHAPPDAGDITLSDMERIHQAASLLAEDMQNPPKLFDLARSVGLSHAKMNRGFHQVFNTTVFGYLREIRLAQAKQLLESRRMNVTEAAFMVGYNSLSSFSRAFHRQFGVTPHKCTRN